MKLEVDLNFTDYGGFVKTLSPQDSGAISQAVQDTNHRSLILGAGIVADDECRDRA